MVGARFSIIVSFLLCHAFVPPTHCDWEPKIYNCIKWTAANQGKLTIEYTSQVGITRVPMAYHGGVDTNASGEITEKNIRQFTAWVREVLPRDYCGPVVMDYEQPWWKELRAKTIDPERLQAILSVYIKGMQVARDLQPTSQWGYWGFPCLRHSSDDWLEQPVTLEPLIGKCKALYPDVYNCSPGVDRTAQAEEHISTVLKLAAGRMPVYAFVSMRYCGKDVDHSVFVPEDIFLRQVNAAMQASWTDDLGTQHKIKGIILWDAYGFSPESEWGELDKKHKTYFEMLQALSKAWAEAMHGKSVVVGPPLSEECMYGLAEPRNSSEAIYDKAIDRRDTEIQEESAPDTRVPSGLIKGNRITD